jgi:hypothetical protein
MPATFHGVVVGNHDLKIVDDIDTTIDFLGNRTMNKIMGVATVNKDYYLPMLNVANDLEGFGRREANEGIQQNQWFKF